jgi:hypothetical protein
MIVSAKLSLKDRRNRLLTTNLEYIEWLHHWLYSGLIQDVMTTSNEKMMDLEEMAEEFTLTKQ